MAEQKPLQASVARMKRSGNDSCVAVRTVGGTRRLLYQWTPKPATYLLASGSAKIYFQIKWIFSARLLQLYGVIITVEGQVGK